MHVSRSISTRGAAQGLHMRMGPTRGCMHGSAARMEPSDTPTPVQAEARQQQFESTAVGKAAYKGVKEAKKPANASSANDNARDWLS